MNRKNISVLICLFIIPFCGYGRLIGQARLDSLLLELPHVKAESRKLSLLSAISYEYANIDLDKGLKFAGEALKLAKQLGADEGIANAYNSFARNYLIKGVLDSALDCNLKALHLYEKTENKDKTAQTLSFVAMAYESASDFSNALEYQFRALKKFEELKNEQFIARALLSIANIYSGMSDPKAITYDLDALKLYEKLGDKRFMALCYLNMGTCYYLQNKYEQSLDYFLKALKLSKDAGATDNVQIEIGNIGSTYLALGNLPLALNYAFEALQLSHEAGDKDGIISSYEDIGRAYLALSKADNNKGKLPDSLASTGKSEFLRKSIVYLNSALQANSDRSNRVLYYESLKSLSEAYDLNGDVNQAFKTYRLFTQIKDSVFSEDTKVKIARQETKREADLRQKQIEINELSKANGKRRTEFMLAGIGIMLVVTTVVARSNKKLAAEKKTSEKLRSELEETLEQKDHLVQKLSDAADMKSKFFANVSHELRTPVTILTGMLDLMKRKGGEVEKNKLEIALGNSRRLQMMVEEMLDISKHENPGSETRYEIKDIAAVVQRIALSVSPYIEQSKIKFSFESGGIEGVFVSTDEEKLEKIITNLIYNAGKFNREGGSIKVSLSLSQDRKWVNIVVKDTGLGIDDADLPHIFDRYYQSNASNAKARGVGIGLSLVREFTDLLGGRVSVSSKLGKGTSFTLEFPVFEGEVSEILADLDDLVIPDVDLDFSHPYTILLVEDNTEMRFYLKEILSGNVTVVEMSNGKEALEWLKSNPADMVISDIMMPEMDGREFMSILKNDQKFRKIPTIAISALSDQASQLNLLSLGIDDYIVKPFNATELRIRVRNVLTNLEERKKHEELPAEPGDVPESNLMAEEFKTKIRQYVLAKMKKSEVTVADVASEFALGERQLHRLAKSLTGCTPAQLIKEVKLQKAYELVTNREVSKVETLAKEVGFENISYFTKLFAERFGKKPSEFF